MKKVHEAPEVKKLRKFIEYYKKYDDFKLNNIIVNR